MNDLILYADFDLAWYVVNGLFPLVLSCGFGCMVADMIRKS